MTATPGGPRQQWLIPSAGTLRDEPVAEVAVRKRVFRLVSYAVPAEIEDRVRPGVLLRVPFGRRAAATEGWCVRVSRQSYSQTRPAVLSVEAGDPLLTPPLIELGLWLSDYYVCPPGRVFEQLAPSPVRKPPTRRVVYVRATGADDGGRLTDTQRSLLARFGSAPLRRGDLLADGDISAATLRTLVRRGLVTLDTRREPRSDATPPETPAAATPFKDAPEDAFALTSDQQAAIGVLGAALAEPSFGVHLLFGVPGSGKTEVYVRVIRQAVAAGRQAILIVPEIALATQLVERLTRRFERTAVLHSRLTPAARRDALRRAAAGGVDVVIGTRSAVFAPLPRLGLIAIDEEQETALKHLAAPFYHARDVAIKRGQIERVPVLLGSATPALETWWNAANRPHYRLLRLNERVPGARLPTVRRVAYDARAPGAAGLLSAELVHELRATLAAGQQAILLHNRRGYAAHLRCQRCGLVLRCPQCEAALVYHRASGELKCHRCGRRSPLPTECPDDSCRGALERSGLAIQRVEEDVQRVVPAARLLRLDSDRVTRREHYAAALEQFAARQADVLLGTQMVAKGLDFPGVRLVGAIDADAALWLPDFRAGERAFQLIVQVCGRAGRREGESLALVQARDTEAAVLCEAAALDYESFAARELELRRELKYPPFVRLARLLFLDERPGRARDESRRVAEALQGLAGRVHAGLEVAEAGPCPVARQRGLFRYQVIVSGPRDASVQQLLHRAQQERLLSPRVRRLTIDVDPVDML